MAPLKHYRTTILLSVGAILCVGVSMACGYAAATSHYYWYCLDGWHEQMSLFRKPAEVAHWGDWPGRNQCWHQTADTFGWMGTAIVPRMATDGEGSPAP
jgi:hypothetical protein